VEKDKSSYSDTSYQIAIEAETHRTIARTIGVCFVIVSLTLMLTVTYCQTRPREMSTAELSQINCTKAGNVWMPVITHWSNEGDYQIMSCISKDQVSQVLQSNREAVRPQVVAVH
jgi:hypothetical protein